MSKAAADSEARKAVRDQRLAVSETEEQEVVIRG